jgi:hypothetical protein
MTRGTKPFVVHTLVRLAIGLGVVARYAILVRVFSPHRAMLAAAGSVWVFGTILPFAVVVEWGLFPWALAAKLWSWNLLEILIAASFGRALYRS